MSVYSVNVYPSCTTIKTGHWYYDAYAIVNTSSNCFADVEWYSDNTNIATVNASSGYIYGRNPGTARIYARSIVDRTKKDYITVTVTSGTICVESITLNRSSISLEKGDRYTLSTTVCPINATNKSICWRSTNTSVATVNAGVVTAKARGYTYIYAEAQDGSGEYDSCYVNVTEDILVTSVTVSPSCKTMNIGDSDYLYETVCPTNATNKCVKWRSDKTSVATVNPDTGFVMAQGAGTATITATAQDGSNKKGYCTITVNTPVAVTGVTVCPASLTMNVGDIEYLCASITPSNATNKTVTWCSSNENVATVGLYTGKVTAKKAGSTTITATTHDGHYVDNCVLIISSNWPVASQPTIIDRSAWEARDIITSRLKKRSRKSERIVFHHSAEKFSSTNCDDVIEEIQRIQNLHMDDRGKSDIAYHFIIDPAGRIWEGAVIDDYQRGHADNYFDDIGILLLGDFESRLENIWNSNELNSEQKEAMKRISKWLCYTYDLSSVNSGENAAPINTHRGVNPNGTVCPGENAAPWIENELRRYINDWNHKQY